MQSFTLKLFSALYVSGFHLNNTQSQHVLQARDNATARAAASVASN